MVKLIVDPKKHQLFNKQQLTSYSELLIELWPHGVMVKFHTYRHAL